MKKLTKWFIYMVPVIVLATVISSCDKDDDDKEEPKKEETTDYAGIWESAAYESYSLTGDPIYEKMIFEFTDTEFEDKIYQGASASSLSLTSGMKGTVDNTEDGVLDVEIMEISLLGASYTNKETDSVTFYNTFNATLGQMLYEEFEAEYIIDGDTMQLIIPVKIPTTTIVTTDTLNLTKM